MYEWHILTRKDNELIKKIYQAMSIKSCKNDFSIIIQQEKEKYNILLSKEEISKLSKRKYKLIVDSLVNKFAYQEMMEMARRQSKCTEIIKTYDPEKFQIQGYLKSNKFPREYKQV